MNNSDNNDQVSKSPGESQGFSDEELILELDNMLEEDGGKESADSLNAGLVDIDEAALDIGMDEPEELIDIIDDEEVIDLDEGAEAEAIGLEHGDIVQDDDVIDLSDDEHIEELSDEDIVSDNEPLEDELLEIEDLVSDETLQYDPLLSKSKTDDLYIEDAPHSSLGEEDYDEIELVSDYDSGFMEDGELEITSDMDISDDSFPYGDSSLMSGISVEQVEAAVERVITRLFTDRIETMLSEVIERVVREELSNLKKSLTSNNTDDQ